MGGSPRVRFEPEGIEVVVPLGSTLLEAARQAGVGIDAPCAGRGRCGSCQVVAFGELSALTRDERELLGGAGISAGKRLACRARVLGPATVRLAGTGGFPQVSITGTRPATQATVEDARQTGDRTSTGLGASLGAAVDIGTTTVAVSLVDLTSGDVLVTASDLNAQRSYGADIITRVTAAQQGRAGELRQLVTEQVDALLRTALAEAGSDPAWVGDAVVVGNTAMIGLFLGKDVTPLAAAPYAGAFTDEVSSPGSSVGLLSVPDARVYVPRAISAFIGSDIAVGLVATWLTARTAPTLFVDLGTNGEIVLAHGGGLLAASAAAGPAFEGAAIECGMRAVDGAVERVALTETGLELGVVGGVAPTGICGSGLLDLVALLLDAGVLDATGRFVVEAPGALGRRVVERDGVRVFVVELEAGIVLTQHDVRHVQLAVGAVRTGIDLLLAEAGVDAEDVAQVIIAGGFGYHVRAEALARLGLIPGLWRDRVSFAGNTALEGARLLLLDEAARTAVREVALRVRALDLATHPQFQQRFLAALSFPEPLGQ